MLAFTLLTFLVLSINMKFSLPARVLVEEDEAIEEEIAPVVTPKNETKSFNSAFNEVKDLKLSPEEEAELLNFEVISKAPVEEPLPTKEAPIAEIKDTAFEVITAAETSLTELPKEEVKLEENQMDLTGTAEPELVLTPKGEPELEIAATVEEPVAIEEENKAAKLVEQFGEYDPTLDLGSYQFPHFDLLNDYGNIQSRVNQEELIANKNKILSTLKNYGIEIDKIMATVGPTVTLYEIVPAAGVRISKIKNLEDDIALSLAALGIRIIAPIPGKGTIGIEVPNQTPEMVPMKNILASEKFNTSTFELPIA
ncbi:MAG: DNA translocase FtsK, partial [Bacteroidia bacterium]|nr:DNA translocase FtsK [Bacteroidia bacterium]